MLVDHELTERNDKRLSSRLRQARLRHNAPREHRLPQPARAEQGTDPPAEQ